MKNKIVKIFSLLLVMCMMCSAFVGCGSNEDVSSDLSSNTSDVESDATDTNSEDSSDSSEDNKSDISSTTSNKDSSNVSTGNVDPYEGAEKYRGQTVKAVLWFVPSASEKASIEAFEKKFGINVEIESTANDMDIYSTRVAAIIASGEHCDVTLVQNINIFNNAKNVLKPLDSIKTFHKDDPALDKEAMDALKVRGKYYSLNVKSSWQTDSEVMYFNSAAFKKRGVKSPKEYYNEGNWNWDTFLECAKAMTYTENGTNYYGYTATEWYSFASSAGIDLVDYNGTEIKSNINNPTLVSALKFTNELYNKHKVCSPKFYDIQRFCNGTVAMFSNLTYQMTKEQTGFTNLSSGVEVDAVPFPSPKGSKTYTPASYKGFGVMKTSKNPEAAVLFIRWFLDPANDKREYINPNFAQLREKVSYDSNKVVAWAEGVMNYGSSTTYDTFLFDCGNNADSAQISTTMQRYEKILNNAINKCNRIIKK